MTWAPVTRRSNLLCFIVALAGSAFTCVFGSETFTNPIIGNGADPWVVYQAGYYYLTYTTGSSVLDGCLQDPICIRLIRWITRVASDQISRVCHERRHSADRATRMGAIDSLLLWSRAGLDFPHVRRSRSSSGTSRRTT